MQKIILLFLVTIILASSCRERKLKGAFQGTWYKQGYTSEAFSVREDSMYYPGIKKGYYYDFNKDTLVIQFTEKEVKRLILSFSSRKIIVWDMSLSQDTIVLQRRPNSELDTLDFITN